MRSLYLDRWVNACLYVCVSVKVKDGALLCKIRTRGVCACVTHFIQRECSWQRATGTLITQDGKASRRLWLMRSSVRDSSCLAWGESGPHLEQTQSKSIYQKLRAPRESQKLFTHFEARRLGSNIKLTKLRQHNLTRWYRFRLILYNTGLFNRIYYCRYLNRSFYIKYDTCNYI